MKDKSDQVTIKSIFSKYNIDSEDQSWNDTEKAIDLFFNLSLDSLKWFIQIPYNAACIQQLYDDGGETRHHINQRINAINKHLDCNFFITTSDNYAKESK